MGKVLDLDAKTFEKKVLKQKGHVLVYFFADWCGPCKAFAPIVEKVAGKLNPKVLFGKIDIEQAQDIASKYSIVSVPTLLVFKNGKPIDQFGYLTEEQLEQKARQYLS